jgi:hypothetical protein
MALRFFPLLTSANQRTGVTSFLVWHLRLIFVMPVHLYAVSVACLWECLRLVPSASVKKNRKPTQFQWCAAAPLPLQCRTPSSPVTEYCCSHSCNKRGNTWQILSLPLSVHLQVASVGVSHLYFDVPASYSFTCVSMGALLRPFWLAWKPSLVFSRPRVISVFSVGQ